jgi:hypothetical protein
MTSLGAAFLILRGVLIGVASILDRTYRERMASIGYHNSLLQGGAFNYAEYHKVRVWDATYSKFVMPKID